jgi:hypothetical protein
VRETRETEETHNPLADLLEGAENLGLGGEVLVGFRRGILASITLAAEGTELVPPPDADDWQWQVLAKATRHWRSKKKKKRNTHVQIPPT